MSKIGLIIKREYTTRIRKKSFLIMTLLGPLFFVGIVFAPIIIASTQKSNHRVVLVDYTHIFSSGDSFKDAANIHYDFGYAAFDSNKVAAIFKDSEHVSVLVIPTNIETSKQVLLYSKSGAGDDVENDIERQLDEMLERAEMRLHNISPEVEDQIKTNIRVHPIISAHTEMGYNMMLGLVASFLIYFFIFLYSVQVMRGVMEEKINRIVEVIISSVKPFQLMMGKVIGVALVGFTQFVMWLVMSYVLFTIGSSYLQGKMVRPDNTQVVKEQVMKQGMPQQSVPSISNISEHKDKLESGLNNIDEDLRSTNWPLVIGMFIFYFIGGYLLYSSLFAAIGSAVDQETDTQQFMLPVTAPLILSIIIMQSIIQEPNSKLAFWASIIPLTSPIAMMARIPFGVDWREVALSMALLVASFFGTIWLAGRIYRVGLLMYGKKITYKELGKWLFYK